MSEKMPSDSKETRNDLIESPINREAAGALSVLPHAGGLSAFAIAPKSMSDVMEFAKLMAVSGVCVRSHFRKNPGACLAVTLQAMKWGADPFAVANKAYVVNDQLAYEAQLVHAIVNSSTMLTKRLDAAFEGDGTHRRCRIVGHIKGDDTQKEYISPEIGAIPTKNSPLWKSDPDQQLFYYSSRAWVRRWLPDVLLGIYTPDELTGAVDITPRQAEPEPPRGRDIIEPPRGNAITHQTQESQPFLVVDCDGEEHEYATTNEAFGALEVICEEAARRGSSHLEAALENNAALIAELHFETGIDESQPNSPAGTKTPDTERRHATAASDAAPKSAGDTDLLGDKRKPKRDLHIPMKNVPSENELESWKNKIDRFLDDGEHPVNIREANSAFLENLSRIDPLEYETAMQKLRDR